MAKYDLLLGITAIIASTTPPEPQGQVVTPAGPTNPNSPPQEQAFQLEVVGIGSVSVTAQIIVSNDEYDDPSLINWSLYGSAITATGTNLGTAVVGGTQPWKRYGAYVTAISGTNAKASLKMNA